jgi:hypothetical protein
MESVHQNVRRNYLHETISYLVQPDSEKQLGIWMTSQSMKIDGDSASHIKANAHIPCRFPSVPISRLIHTCHPATLPFSDCAVSLVKVHVIDGNIGTDILLLVTTFVELRVVAGRSRTRAGRPHAVSGRPMLIHTYHAFPMPLSLPRCAVALRGRFQNAWSWHGRGTAWHV